MQKIIQVRNIKLGEGIPKICVPLVGTTNEALLAEVSRLKALNFDIVEWRMDYYKEIKSIENTKEILALLRAALGEAPLLATFRSKKEGGQCEISTEYYIQLNKEIAATGMADLIDVELFAGDEAVQEIVDFAHSKNTKVIMSNHDFDKTPAQDELVNRLCKMQALNADLPKIAVMPQSATDVLTLLCATDEMVKKHADRPIITMSMGGLGTISRIAGEVFGSALTFGAASSASAPGQLPVSELSEVLNLLHKHQ